MKKRNKYLCKEEDGGERFPAIVLQVFPGRSGKQKKKNLLGGKRGKTGRSKGDVFFQNKTKKKQIKRKYVDF